MRKTVHKQYRIKHRAARKKGQTKVCPFLFHNPHRGVLAAEPYPPKFNGEKRTVLRRQQPPVPPSGGFMFFGTRYSPHTLYYLGNPTVLSLG